MDPSLVCPPAQPGFAGVLGPYHILRELGAGGMGVVYLAAPAAEASRRLPSTSSQVGGPPFVAIKVLRPELTRNPRALKRFLSEARHMGQFQHPHIIRVLEISAVSRRPYLVMPYMAGGSLAGRLRRQGPPKTPAALRLALQVAEALAHAHSKGIIHRDLNPANVLLDAEDNACLSDFGLARTVFNDCIAHVDREHHEGTLPYMSPAVARGEAEDTRCDIYGVGALLYELLTGHRPYEGSAPADTRNRILVGPPEPILALNPRAPAALACVADWAMARELRQRYAHMKDLVSDLRRVSEGLEPLGPHAKRRVTPPGSSARRVTLNPLLRRTGQRPGRSVLLLAISALALLAGGFFLATGPASPAQRVPHRAPAESQDGSTSRQVQPALAIAKNCVADLDGDGRGEFLLVLPRVDGQGGSRLCCFDFSQAHLRWQRFVPGEASTVRVADVDDDGRVEILVCGGSPGEPAASVLAVLEVDGTPRRAGPSGGGDAADNLLTVSDELSPLGLGGP
jgi:serine/threonine protein kinase